MKKGLLALLVILLSVGTLAQTNSRQKTRPKRSVKKAVRTNHHKKPYIDDLYFGVGSLTEFVGHVQVDENGGTESFSFTPYLSVGLKTYLYDKGLSWLPEFGMSLPHKGADENTSRWNFHLVSKFAYEFNESFALNAGLGLSWVRLSLDGGTQTLQNGNSVDEFPMPEGSSVSQNLIMTLGGSGKFDPNWGASADFHIFNIEDSESRAWSYIISVNYHFGKVEFDL